MRQLLLLDANQCGRQQYYSHLDTTSNSCKRMDTKGVPRASLLPALCFAIQRISKALPWCSMMFPTCTTRIEGGEDQYDMKRDTAVLEGCRSNNSVRDDRTEQDNCGC